MESTFSAPDGPLTGRLSMPGDKSLSHRAILFSALAGGVSHVRGVLDSEDVRATVSAVSALGAEVELDRVSDGSLSGTVHGWGASGPVQPEGVIDCGNSGTTARLLMGVLAGWPVSVTLVGDESLSRRPMLRVTEPLTAMGARFETSDGRLPVTIHGVEALRPFAYESPVASAQVKTAILLAGVRARGGVRVSEPAPSRDHTERLLPAYGVPVKIDPVKHAASLCGPIVPSAADIAVPGDPSSAAFMACAALIVPSSDVHLDGVSLNPTRTGFLSVLERMGAEIEFTPDTPLGGEPVGSIRVLHTPGLIATRITPMEVPSLVDEVPVLALVASQASGTTRFDGIGELRVKESDRLAAIADGLGALGVTVRTGDDWLEVDGPARLNGVSLDSLGDHRLAMTWALAGMISSGPVTVERFDAVDVSYPHFSRDLASLGA